MNYNEALRILELKEGFTELDLIKAYRHLANMYHPDRFGNATEEERQNAENKMKEINAARDYLKKYKKVNSNEYKNNTANNNENYNEEYYSLRKYGQEKIDELIKIYDFDLYLIKDIELRHDMQLILIKIEMVITSIYEESQRYFGTKKTIDAQIDYLKTVLNKDLLTFKKKYYDLYKMNDSNINEKFNWWGTINDFWNQLETARKEYMKIMSEKVMDAYFKKYENYNYYQELVKVIDVYKKSFIASFEKNKNNSDIVEHYNEKISGVFNIYLSYVEALNKLKGIITDISNDEINMKYQAISSKVKEGYVLTPREYKDLNVQLTELNNLINSYLYEKNNPIVGTLFQTLCKRFYEVIISLDALKDQKLIDETWNIYKNVIELFKQYILRNINFENLKALESITFINILKDKELLMMLNKDISIEDNIPLGSLNDEVNCLR